ncbi:hypothetical protein SteCoe_20045 [Stentor coeruleus]|uniref:Uncharacterized protein n=1 Tax=Stentor coeruleus TaxID=5963 RepID=A0A1R2BSR9_9CILI|nr:hypothetical protein SteCoe_20045 [Stentor coeruleus]
MYFKPSKNIKSNSPLLRSHTPTDLIESPRMTLASYKFLIKKSKEKTPQLKSKVKSPLLKSKELASKAQENQPTLNTESSTNTCIFSSPITQEPNEASRLKIELRELQAFIENGLLTQRKYYEEIITGLEQDIKNDKEYFNKEISLIREEIKVFKELKKNKRALLHGNQLFCDLGTDYFKNQELISTLERHNQLLYEKITKSK